jgi:hypothetical protein
MTRAPIGSTCDRWARVGRSLAADGRSAGSEAAGQAQADRPAGLLMVFCSAQHDPAQVLAGVCAVTPDDVLIVGGTSMGEIAPPCPGPTEFGSAPGVVAMALGGPGFQLASTVVPQASARRRESGAACAAAMSGITAPHQVLLMIADGLTREQHELVRGAYSVLGASVPIVGGCSADNLQYALTHQFHGTGAGVQLLVDSVVGVGLGSTAPIGVGIAHGWTKHGDPMVVTSSVGGEIFLLDGEPAVEVYLRNVGADRSQLADLPALRELLHRHPLGLSRRSGEDLRAVYDTDLEHGSLVCLADVPQGALVWIMSTDQDALIEAAARSCQQAADGLDGAEPLGFLLFDCGARRQKLGPAGTRAEQAAIARAANGAPFAGFYTYGEVGRVHGAHGMHQLTVVTLALS